MRYFVLLMLSTAVSVGLFDASCNNPAAVPADQKQAGAGLSKYALPPNADTISVGFRDQNAYSSNGMYCVAAIVDSKALTWQRIWVRVQLLDEAGKVLAINGDTSGAVVRTMADAVPPLGATSMFFSAPLTQISGTPAGCRLSGAGGLEQSPGPILICYETGGVRISYPDTLNPKKNIETVFQASGTVENPLDVMAPHFNLVVLIYGKDEKLYFVQAVDPEDQGTALLMERSGPLIAKEKRKITLPVYYQQLPEVLRQLLISKVLFQVYEVRN